jgi:hypothetical protein
MNDVSINWTELREFRAVGLTQSFILSWQMQDDALRIDLDLLLLPEHAFYEKPRPSEGACFRPAMLEFPHCARVSSDGNTGGASSEVVSGLSHGRISGMRLTADGQYEIQGNFGTIKVHAERPILRLQGPGT